MIKINGKPLCIREKDRCQWMLFKCPSCQQKVWLDYGNVDNLNLPDPDGFKCCYCQTEVIFDDCYDVLFYMYEDSVCANETLDEHIKARTSFWETKEECPITEKIDEYDPKERKIFLKKCNELTKIMKKWEDKKISTKQMQVMLKKYQEKYGYV